MILKIPSNSLSFDSKDPLKNRKGQSPATGGVPET